MVGSSGCGKSTLLDLLGLVARPTTADIFNVNAGLGEQHDVSGYWRENNEHDLALLRCRMMGYVMQTGGLFPYLTVWDNLLLPSRLKGLDHSYKAVAQLAVAFNLVPQDNRGAQDQFFRKKPRSLSGGQRQRTAIIRALLSEPAVILADEPTAAIDGITASQIVQTLGELARLRQVIVIMVTHDRPLVRSVATRAYSFQLSASNNNGHITSSTVEINVESL